MDMYINYLMNRPVSLDEMISSLMDEWLTRAIITGKVEHTILPVKSDSDELLCLQSY